MRGILSLRPWLLFLIVILPMALVAPSPYKEIINSIGIAFGLWWLYATVTLGQKEVQRLGIKTLDLKWVDLNIKIIPVIVLFLLLIPKASEQEYPLLIFPQLVFIYFVFAIGQLVLYAAITIATLEQRKTVSFSDYFWTVFWYFFFIVGIFVLQEKINKLIGNKAAE